MVIVVRLNFTFELNAFTSISHLIEKTVVSFKKFSQIITLLPMDSLTKSSTRKDGCEVIPPRGNTRTSLPSTTHMPHGFLSVISLHTQGYCHNIYIQ